MSDLEKKLEAIGKNIVDFLGALTEHVQRDGIACEALLACLSKDTNQAVELLDRFDPKGEELLDISTAANVLCLLAYERSKREPNDEVHKERS